jgi:putative phosphoribosyl transferase
MASSEISIPLDGIRLGGELHLAKTTAALVLFAHGSGSSRHSPRNQFVARVLRQAGLGTLLFDLMTAEEERSEAYTRHLRFDIEFLSRRLVAATQWVLAQGGNANIGYFGSSTGAAAALLAAVESGNLIQAVVSRGGRPDLAGAALERVRPPTLLIVGGDDTEVIALNQTAYARLPCEKAFRLVAGATHLFEEEGALEQVATMASEWFANHLTLTATRN